MTRTYRRARFIAAFMLVLPFSACGPHGFQPPPGEDVIGVGTPGAVLTCAQAGVPVKPDTQVVGSAPATMRAGASELRIPGNAMPGSRRLIFSRAPGNQVGVAVDSAVHFVNGQSARLIIDVSDCPDSVITDTTWFVWRVHQGRGQSQKLSTQINPARAITWIDSTSVFMIAN